jgi:hypothetical protein
VVTVFNKINNVLEALNISLRPRAPVAYPPVPPAYIAVASAPLVFATLVVGFSEISRYFAV